MRLWVLFGPLQLLLLTSSEVVCDLVVVICSLLQGGELVVQHSHNVPRNPILLL